MTGPQERPATPSGFGYRIESREPLRFLRSGGGVETLTIAVAPEPRPRPTVVPLADWTLAERDAEARATLYHIGRTFEFWTPGSAGYRIDPEAARIEIPDDPDPIGRERHLWGVPTALCFMYRGDVPLHAAAVEIGGRAVLFAAPRRRGKTTLAFAFQRHGYRVLTEDLACCRPGPAPSVLPGPAMLRVRRDVYDGTPSPGTRVVAERGNRVYLAIDEARRGSSASVPIAAMIFLREFADAIALERLDPSAAVRDLWALSFRLPTDEGRAHAFSQLTRLAGTVHAWSLRRPARLDCLDATVGRIVSLFGEWPLR